VFPPDIIAGVQVRIETDNETVRVLRIKLQSGQQLPRLGDHPGVMVCLTECHLSFQDAEEVHLRAGQTHWVPVVPATTTNVTNAAVELLYIENKRP
jgi:hypothetical protein